MAGEGGRRGVFGRGEEGGAGSLEGERKGGAAAGSFDRGSDFGVAVPDAFAGSLRSAGFPGLRCALSGLLGAGFPAWGAEAGALIPLRGGLPCLQGSFGSFFERRLLSGRIAPRKSDFCDRLPRREGAGSFRFEKRLLLGGTLFHGGFLPGGGGFAG